MSTATLKSAEPPVGPESLAAGFLKLQQSGKSGTLILTGPDGRKKYVYFRAGIIELVKTRRSKTLLGRALIKRRMLNEQQLQTALERQAAGGHQLRLGQILIGMGICPADELQKALTWQIAEEILELFTWPTLRSDFVRGDPPLDIYESEDLQARAALEPKKLVLEAERRANELDAIRRTVPSMADVYKPTASAERYLASKDGGIEREVVSCTDGQRDVAEVLDDVRAPDLQALRVLSKLIQSGELAPVAPAQLVALGQECEDRREFERARSRYLRADELGHQDFDIPKRIGQMDEVLGDIASACQRYLMYAERCAQANYPDVAAATFTHALQLASQVGAPSALQSLAREARSKLAATLEKAGHTEEASAEYLKLLKDLPQDTPIDERIRTLTSILALSDLPDLREQLAELYLEQGDPGEAIMALQDVAAGALAEQNFEKGIKVLERILVIEPHEFLTRQQLASTLANAGMKDRAVAEYLKTVELMNESGLASASAQLLVQIYEKVVELDPLNAQARRWLAQAYEGKAEADKAIQHMSGMVEALRKASKKDELASALDKLCTYQPDDHDIALERARLKKDLGKTDEARAAFKALADAALKSKEHDLAQECLAEVLHSTPGDLESQVSLARVESQSNEHGRAARRYGAVFEIAFLSGRLELADEAIKRAIDIEPDAPVHRERTARLQEARSQPIDAARTLVKAARLARSDDDQGQARLWLRRALELDSECDEARELIEQVKRVAVVPTAATTDGQPGPAAPAAPLPRYEPARGSTSSQKVMPTIVGGGSGNIQIQGYTTRRLGGIADRLKEIKSSPESETAAPGAARSDIYQPPAETNEDNVKNKARSAMDRLRAIKSGAPAPAPASDVSSDAVPREPSPTANAPAGTPGSSNTVTEPTIAKRASNAMDRLRAMKGGAAPPSSEERVAPPPPPPPPAGAGGSRTSPSDDALRALGVDIPPPPAEPPPPPPPPPAASAAPAPSTGRGLPRLPKTGAASANVPAGTPGSKNEVVAPELAKKASSAMDRLKAMKSGGAAPPKPGASPAGPLPDKISKGPEAPGEAADPALSKKASSARDRLRAMRGGGGTSAPGAPGAGQAPNETPGNGGTATAEDPGDEATA